MQHNFMLFSELQKKVSPSPIKTWRLLDRMRTEGRMKEGDDYVMTDRKLYVNVPRFVVELEAMGYAVKSDDIKNGEVISDDIKKLYEELRLISDEITNSRIQEEMKSDEITHGGFQGEVKSNDIKNASFGAEVKSDDISRYQMKSPDIRYEEPVPKSDGISSTVISSEINLKSPEFNMLLRGKDEIIESKKEQIEHMKEMYTEILKSKDEMLKSKDMELKEVRTALDTVVKQNDTLVHQNVFLTRLLTGPKEERARQPDEAVAHEFRDVTDMHPEPEDLRTEPEPVPAASHEAPVAAEEVLADEPPVPDVHLASEPIDTTPVVHLPSDHTDAETPAMHEVDPTPVEEKVAQV